MATEISKFLENFPRFFYFLLTLFEIHTKINLLITVFLNKNVPDTETNIYSRISTTTTAYVAIGQNISFLQVSTNQASPIHNNKFNFF